MPDSPVTYTAVRDYLKLSPGVDVQLVEDAVDAVNDLLLAWKGTEFPYRHVYAGVMLAARIYRRRNSSSGVESMGDLGPVYIQRNDPDIAMLLEIGSYRKPMVG
ncbi:hypothetical protein [Rhodococcus sp. IEGM 1318]|uniref:hypothetical protein n=1 Tax=Rhodococcus sp. IEGM 1318 TaxID=3082226 RepID=UPI0029535B57|nr:hypothetical protein [Rhodococcus sp. IEGM 1318]MDV8003852.1 hypothetical protein [Rhodococcus sp. IEGM 1318]